MIDPMAPILADIPPEWDTLPPELIARLAPNGVVGTSPDHRALINRIAAGRWFLVKNELRTPCTRCRGKHDYITLACTEAPFSGLRSILLFWGERVDADLFYNAMTVGSIVPITQANANDLNQRIRDRHEQPIHEQRPLKAEEVNADLIRQRMWRTARTLRQRG